MKISRRNLMGLLAGALVFDGELWVPGQKLISIPRLCLGHFGDAFMGVPGYATLNGVRLKMGDKIHAGDTFSFTATGPSYFEALKSGVGIRALNNDGMVRIPMHESKKIEVTPPRKIIYLKEIGYRHEPAKNIPQRREVIIRVPTLEAIDSVHKPFPLRMADRRKCGRIG